jgi:hypothetical protein
MEAKSNRTEFMKRAVVAATIFYLDIARALLR